MTMAMERATLGSVEILNRPTRDKIAVCQLFGLHYWADHPLPGRMWAVDDEQQSHVIRWYRSKGIAVRQAGGYFGARSFDTGIRVVVSLETTEQELGI